MGFFKNRKYVLLLIGFIAAAGLAVFSFTNGILQYGHRDPGYYDVGLTDQGNAVLYGSGTHLLYYAEGRSSEIRLELNRVQKIFSEVLLNAYKMLDSQNTYEEIPNIAALNQNPGQEIRIGEELFAVLSDALERSGKEQGYDLFAGALFHEWQTLLYLEEPSDFDPALNQDEAELLSAITETLLKPGMISLKLTAPDTAALNISPEYQQFAEAREIEAPGLDLNLLHDAYLLQLTAKGLKAQGIRQGYLYSESGCSLWLDAGERDFSLYGYDGTSAAPAGTMRLQAPLAWCQLTAFPVTKEQKGYYRIAQGENSLMRHPFINSLTGEPGTVLEYAALSGGEDQIVDLAFMLAVLNSQQSPEDIEARMAALPDDISAVWSFRNSDHQLHIREKDSARITLNEDSGYRLIPLHP